jgi:hypothetical protein
VKRERTKAEPMICPVWFKSRYGKTSVKSRWPPEAKGRLIVCGRLLELTPEPPQKMRAARKGGRDAI